MSVDNEQEDMKGYTYFNKMHTLYGKMVQHVRRHIRDCKVISFSGKRPFSEAEEPDMEER